MWDGVRKEFCEAERVCGDRWKQKRLCRQGGRSEIIHFRSGLCVHEAHSRAQQGLEKDTCERHQLLQEKNGAHSLHSVLRGDTADRSVAGRTRYFFQEGRGYGIL